ncbi:RING/FYVE/PHD zinc finger superfamily protein [Artemisia annua]|uniref:RING/FYVE/PHD zinc finger superfamily protein n=1 Tax=Artemisia annua TaxID=35608 RepID=A0A2U1NXA0_ARTAN|nr:RING/FYVE/PHD zinc finger superfamily protein [Artemisia annua]
MGDQLVLDVNRLVKPVSVENIKRNEEMVGLSSCTNLTRAADENGALDDEEAPLITTAECRICQEEDSVDILETPCSCNGSLKYAHRKCVQHWCNEKGDITCEICHQSYQPGYTAPPPRARLEETTIDIGGGWQISGTPMDLNDPRLLAIAEAERQFLEAEYEDYNASNASGAAFCRSAVLILMALLLLRHAVTVPESEGDGDADASTFLTLFLLRVAGFLLPCYIMAWAISILQRRRQRQEAAALAASQIAFVLQAGQRRGLHFAIASAAPAPAPSPAPAQAPATAVTPTMAPQEDNV